MDTLGSDCQKLIRKFEENYETSDVFKDRLNSIIDIIDSFRDDILKFAKIGKTIWKIEFGRTINNVNIPQFYGITNIGEELYLNRLIEDYFNFPKVEIISTVCDEPSRFSETNYGIDFLQITLI